MNTIKPLMKYNTYLPEYYNLAKIFAKVVLPT